MTTSMKLMMSSALALLVTLPISAQVRSDDPWFEIELLAFSRAGTIPLTEKFMADVKPIRNLQALDLLSPQYIPDLRPALLAVTPCKPKAGYEFTSLDPLADYREPYDFETDHQPEVTYSLQENSATTADTASFAQTQFLPNSNLCKQFPYIRSNYAEDMMDIAQQQLIDNMAPLSLPTTPLGSDDHQSRPYLAPESALQLKDLAYQLRHRAGHDLLLHMVWRQALTSKSRAGWQRLFAGKRYSPDFNYQGRKQTMSMQAGAAGIDANIEQLYQRLNQQLPLPTVNNEQSSAWHNLPRQVWQLDGQVRLYNERMLFIDSEFNFRNLSRSGDQLQSFYSKDNTRLLLEELHYLDHPHFGIIIQIRRFTPPLAPTVAITSSIAN